MPKERAKKISKTTAPKRVSRTTKTTATAVSPELIAVRAYLRFEARGGVHGHDVDDWIAAEAELRAA